MKMRDEAVYFTGLTLTLGVLGLGLVLPQLSDTWMVVTIVIACSCGVSAFGGYLTKMIVTEVRKNRHQAERVEALLITGSHLRRVK